MQQQVQEMQVASTGCFAAVATSRCSMHRLLSATCSACFAPCSTSPPPNSMRYVCTRIFHHKLKPRCTQLEPLQRADVHLAIAQSAAALMSIYLKATGQLTMQQRNFAQELVREAPCCVTRSNITRRTCVVSTVFSRMFLIHRLSPGAPSGLPQKSDQGCSKTRACHHRPHADTQRRNRQAVH